MTDPVPLPWAPATIRALQLASPSLFTAADVRTVEHSWRQRHPQISLMERAGAAAAALARRLASDSHAPILILAGPGNNGGDALVAARLLAAQGTHVLLASRASADQLPPDAAQAWLAWRESGGAIHTEIPAAQRFSLVIDGLFGVGLQRDLAEVDAQWVARANEAACPRLALDVPSGLDADRGCVRGSAVRADHTLTFLGLKPGLFTADGPDCVGTVHLDTLGIDADTLPVVTGTVLTRLQTRHRLPPRAKNSHKGLFGRVGVIGGAPGMAGAALIAGRAALQHGAGSVIVATFDERIVVDYHEPRLMFDAPETLAASRPDVLAAGPGMGQAVRAHTVLETVLSAPCPLVLDADALNLLANDASLAAQAARRTAPTVLTPHPGEAARLLGTTVPAIQVDRVERARSLAMRFRAHVALKGVGTVIAHPDGSYAISTSGGPWLAQAGSGDRLTGMVAALMGQGMGARDALEAAVWLHGRARPAPISRPAS